MLKVHISPLTAKDRAINKITKLYRRMRPPVFPGGKPTEADYALAFKLWSALDLESKRSYWSPGMTEIFGQPLTPKDLAALSMEAS